MVKGTVQQETAVLLGMIAFGLMHGLNPSHGWMVAVLYSIRSKRPLASSITSSSIIAGAHFISSIAVVVAFILFTTFVPIQISQNYLNYAVAIALGMLAFMFWREKAEDLTQTQHGHLHDDLTDRAEHDHEHWHKETAYHSHVHIHEKRMLPTLPAIASFALVLGFAHEEELVILSLAVGGVSPILLMVAYASSVAASLIGITVLAVRVYTHIPHKVIIIRNICQKLVHSYLQAWL